MHPYFTDLGFRWAMQGGLSRFDRIDTSRFPCSRFVMPEVGLRDATPCESSRIVKCLRRIDSVWVYWTWVLHVRPWCQHGVSIKISINLGKKKYLRISWGCISCLKKLLWPEFWRKWKLHISFPRFWTLSIVLLLNGFDFYFDLFWMTWQWKPAISFSMKMFVRQSILCRSFLW